MDNINVTNNNNIMKNKEFHWNEDTINHFVELARIVSRDFKQEYPPDHVDRKIAEFVLKDCTTEEYETVDDLYKDLRNKVVNELHKD